MNHWRSSPRYQAAREIVTALRQAGHQAFFAGLLAVLGFSLLLGVTALVIRRMLQRRRMAAWDAEWRATGPLWSNYR